MPPAPEGNQPPVIGVFAASPSEALRPGQPVTVTVGVSDPEGDAVQLAWEASGGTLSAPVGAQVVWTPPAASGRYGLRLLASDGRGGATSGTIFATVTAEAVTLSQPLVLRPVPPPASPSPTPSPAASEPASPAPPSPAL